MFDKQWHNSSRLLLWSITRFTYIIGIRRAAAYCDPFSLLLYLYIHNNLHLLMWMFWCSHAFKCLIDYQFKQLLLLAKYDHWYPYYSVRRDNNRGLNFTGHITHPLGTMLLVVTSALAEGLVREKGRWWPRFPQTDWMTTEIITTVTRSLVYLCNAYRTVYIDYVDREQVTTWYFPLVSLSRKSILATDLDRKTQLSTVLLPRPLPTIRQTVFSWPFKSVLSIVHFLRHFVETSLI